ncbi:hypothetical protein SAMN05428995_10351 [Loktanella sp. DSM 29012]|uniref:hypothetical protein n=1 Tax=Loktanella sp. DSM 29012 TaxID=1881056 RepID=UPI0008CAB0B2|nr:hypothetical protein [Loktanella sp. DSM 29012]SEQ15378.1 hypothetical protein SAMN05428995_10351 [Loktanella sp. DSM 29012]
MKLSLSTAAALMLTTAASAGGIDRTLNNYAVLFEDGNYVELGFATVRPDVSGDYPTTAPIFEGGPRVFNGGSTGGMAEDYSTASLSLKYALNEKLDLGLFLNQPFGANAFYPDGDYTGLAAEWDSSQIALVLKYQATPNISVYGGLRSIESRANIVIPNKLVALNTVVPQSAAQAAAAQAQGAAAQAQGGQAQALGAEAQALGALAQQQAAQAAAAAAAQDFATAQTLGASAAANGAQAVALRDQAIALGADAQAQGAAAQALGDQALAGFAAGFGGDPIDGPYSYTATTEKDRATSYLVGVAYERPEIALRVALTYEAGYTHSFVTTENVDALPAAQLTSITEIEMPDVFTLDFQSGVAADTLVFGSIRHAKWSDWEVRPAGYQAITGDRVTGIDDDVTTYRLGVGRQINDQFSAFARVTYEKGNDDVLSRLAPTDGSTAFGIGGTYTNDAFKITGGIEYVTFGDGLDNADETLATNFSDNKAIAVGLSVGYRF